jgi:hypothetical protein
VITGLTFSRHSSGVSGSFRHSSGVSWRELPFPRLIAKSWSAFSKSQVIFKKPTAAKKAESFSKCRRLFGAKNRQMSQL